MVHQFLTPPRIGRLFKAVDFNENIVKTWKVVEVIRKMSNVGHRYEVKVRFIKEEAV